MRKLTLIFGLLVIATVCRAQTNYPCTTSAGTTVGGNFKVACDANTIEGPTTSLAITLSNSVTSGDYIADAIELCPVLIHGSCTTGTFTAGPLYATDSGMVAATGTVNVTAGGLVTFVTGIAFNMGGANYSTGNLWVGKSVTINGSSAGTVSSVSSMTQMQLSGYSGGAQTGVTYKVPAFSCTETTNWTFAATSTCRGFAQSSGTEVITANSPSNYSLGNSVTDVTNSSGIQGEDVYASIMPTATAITAMSLRDFRYLGYPAGPDVAAPTYNFNLSDADELVIFSVNNQGGTIGAASGWTALTTGRANATQVVAKYFTASGAQTATVTDTDDDDFFLGSVIPLIQTGSTAPSLPPAIQVLNTFCYVSDGSDAGCSDDNYDTAYFSNPLTPGSTIIAHIINYSGTTSAPTDTNSALTFTACASGLGNVLITTGQYIGCYCAHNTSSTSVTDGLTISAGAFMDVAEFSNVASCTPDTYGSYPSQTSGSGSNNMKTAGSGSGMTTTKNGDLIYSICATNNGSPSAGTGNTSLNPLGQTQYEIQATAGAINPTMTDSSSSDQVGCLAVAYPLVSAPPRHRAMVVNR